MRYELHTDIEIEAPAEVVWEVLTDLDHYEDWNPFVTSSAGTVVVGETLTNRMQNPGGKAMTIKPKVTAADTSQVFEWLGHIGLPGVFDARHRFEIEPTATGVVLTQSEFFKGVLVRFMRKTLDDSTTRGFEAMNAALKARAEARVGSAS
jgi:hypothetical protein